jgi:hypothetical protein
MADETTPNGQTQTTGNDQTDYKTQFLELSAKIANGDYVAKNVYTGLQTKHEKEVLAHKADVDALNAASVRVSEFETTLKTLQGQHDEFKTKFETTNSQLAVEQTKNQRFSLIMAKFPELVSFEGKGLLPVASSMEELEQKLTTFQETIGAQRQSQRQEQLSGATPPAPGPKNNGENPTTQELLEKARVAQREGKFAEYNRYMDEYYKSLGK